MSTRKSLVFSFLDRYASLAMSIVSSMVIARLLTPAEIGVFSVTMVLLMFVSSVRDMGAGSYLLQERELTTERIRAVWAVQLGLGLALALLVLLASYPVAVFYQEPRMRDIMLVIALNYAVNPFGSLTYAWLMREMQFDSVALMRFASALSGALVSTYLAWKGFGPISLAYGSLTATVVNALLAMYYRPKSFPWMPGLTELRRVLAFGVRLSFSDILGVIAGGAPELLIGKLQSLEAAGLYSRASGLVQMFGRLVVDAVGSVCLPWFSQQAREKDGFAEPFLRATAYVSVVGWFFCVMMVCLAHPIIRILYGSQWEQSVDPVRLLIVATAIGVPASLCKVALMASGAVKLIVRLTLFNCVLTLPLLAIAASRDLIAVSVALIVTSAVVTSVTLRLTCRRIGLDVMTLWPILFLSARVNLLAAIGPVLSVWLFGLAPGQSFLPLLFAGAIGLVGFLTGIFVFNHPLKEEFEAVWVKFRH